MSYQYKREPLIQEEATRLAQACQNHEERLVVWTLLDAGNISYKLTQYMAGAQAVGPVLQGFAKPVSDLSRGASVADIVAAAAIVLALA